MEKYVLGVRIDDISQKEVLERVSEWLSERRRLLVKKSSSQDYGRLVFTPGPEFLVTAQKDLEFKEILNSSDLNVPDGFGLHFAGVHNRVAGVDLMVALCKVAEEKKWSVGLLGGRQQVAAKAAKKLVEKFPELKINFAISDEKADQNVSYYLTDSSIALSFDILECDILFVGLGHPKQEKLLNKIRNSKFEIRNKIKISPKKQSGDFSGQANLKFQIGVGVGGSFDLIAGVKIRAPKIISSMGLEWLWRAIQNPKHFVRVWRATGEFWWLINIFNLKKTL